MKRMNSAYANKLLKQLDDDKSFYLNKEASSCTYIVALGEEPVVPDYDYSETAKTIDEIFTYTQNKAKFTTGRRIIKYTNKKSFFSYFE